MVLHHKMLCAIIRAMLSCGAARLARCHPALSRGAAAIQEMQKDFPKNKKCLGSSGLEMLYGAAKRIYFGTLNKTRSLNNRTLLRSLNNDLGGLAR